jgi:hypothetical protein
VEERTLVWKRGGWCGREEAGVEVGERYGT